MQLLPSLLLSLVLAVIGGFVGRRWPEPANLAACVGGAVLLLMMLLLALTGVGHDTTPQDEVHRWTGHGMVIVLWWLAPFSLGVALGDSRSRGCFMTGSAVLLVVATVIMVLFTSFTGYLYPHDRPPNAEETANRFWVLHGVVMPAITFLMLLGWMFFLWPSRTQLPSLTSKDKSSEFPRGNS